MKNTYMQISRKREINKSKGNNKTYQQTLYER